MLGMCNNFAYIIMLSSAKDILSADGNMLPSGNSTIFACEVRESAKRFKSSVGAVFLFEAISFSNFFNQMVFFKEVISSRKCSKISTGSVLLADILPALIVKIFAPFIMNRVPFGMRHLIVVALQATSFMLVANSKNVFDALFGVVLASAGSGLGEVTYLSLASFYHSYTITAWSSGTGGAGILGSFIYALFTDEHMLGFSPRDALLTMLVVPLIFSFAYWKLLILPPKIHRVYLLNPSTYIVSASSMFFANMTIERDHSSDDELAELIEDEEREHFSAPVSMLEKFAAAKPLFWFMMPLSIVYFAEYFINQGLVELLQFDCSHGFGLSWSTQYKWYQVLYQIGVFISRSSVECFEIPVKFLKFLPVLQMLNAAFFFWDAVKEFIPHVILVFIIIFYEGLLGGAAYANTFMAIHKLVSPERKEFSMAFVSMSDSFGIVCAGILAIPVHNFICNINNPGSI
ncbi:unnamed protein product [Dracunculus medinensis]|uniref:Battenin n=1 Tax=Dracunculus medinensis TaxID=318479 RepID=A0A0N4UQ98_DRAME|nr:unnamed protein product [Dracunculus medinensis]